MSSSRSSSGSSHGGRSAAGAGPPRALIVDEPRVVLFSFPRGFCRKQADREGMYANELSDRFMKERWTTPEHGPVIRDIVRQVRLHCEALLYEARDRGGVSREELERFPFVIDETDPEAVRRFRNTAEMIVTIVNQTLDAMSFLKSTGYLDELSPSPLDRLRDLICYDYGYPSGGLATVMEVDVAAFINVLLSTFKGNHKPKLGIFSSSHKREDMKEMLRHVRLRSEGKEDARRDYSPYFDRFYDKPLIGSSRREETYKGLAASLSLPPATIYFFTASNDSFVAARRAGIRAFLLNRRHPLRISGGGSGSGSGSGTGKTIDIISFSSFDEISFMSPTSSEATAAGMKRGEIRIVTSSKP